MKRLLIFGLSGQIGAALAPMLEAGGYSVLAVSRQARPDTVAIQWLPGSLQVPPTLPAGLDAIVSLGPLDAFADWYGSAMPWTARVIAIGSTSVHSKAAARDPSERRLAAILLQAETHLRVACAAVGSGLTLLRPTLIYGNGRDQSLSPLLALARRWRMLPLPRAATGLRQPVHVEDLASAVLQCLQQPNTRDCSFDLPGGETLSFAAMLERSAKAQAPDARRVPVPLWAFGLALNIAARSSGRLVSARGIVERLRRDQLFDAEPARLAFDYAPRRFSP
jgi:nucleoside-diphosphate-sugar epimerase